MGLAHGADLHFVSSQLQPGACACTPNCIEMQTRATLQIAAVAACALDWCTLLHSQCTWKVFCMPRGTWEAYLLVW